MKVYAYLRISRTHQCEENQRLGVDELAERLGLKIDKYIIDKCPGTVPPYERNFGKILKKANDRTILIVSELTRISRNFLTLMSIMSTFLERKTIVYSAKENFTLKEETLNTVMLLAMYGLSGQCELEMIKARTAENKKRYALRRANGDTSLKPLGRPKGSKTVHHKLDKCKTRLINDYQKGISMSKLARRYNVTQKTIRRYLAKHGKLIKEESPE